MSGRALVARALGACALLASCGLGDDAARGADDARGNGGPSRPPYRAAAVSNGGRIVGTVALLSDVAADGAERDGISRDSCGVFPRRTRLASATDVRAVVWLAGVRSGKPIPAEKRFTVTTQHCDLEPRVQAVVTGGTLNVLNADPVEHRTRFIGAGERPLAAITQFDAGQVVPRTDLLAVPGLLEIRCDLHPWTRGWIHVFDHPYFAEVRSDGSFTIDSIPPGDYHLLMWEERIGTRERSVTVRDGEALMVELGA